MAIKAIFTGVNDKVALSFVKRSRPNRGIGQARRTRKEWVNRVFSREQDKGGVKWPYEGFPSTPIKRIEEQKVGPEKEVRAK